MSQSSIDQQNINLVMKMFHHCEIIAEVPAVVTPAIKISRSQWESICEIVTTLAELDQACPKGLEGAVIEGRVLASVARTASEISFLTTWQGE